MHPCRWERAVPEHLRRRKKRGFALEMIRFSIDGQTVEAAPGTSVLAAALAADIYIPHLCHHPDLPDAGECKQCVVEIEGLEGIYTSCTTPVEKRHGDPHPHGDAAPRAHAVDGADAGGPPVGVHVVRQIPSSASCRASSSTWASVTRGCASCRCRMWWTPRTLCWCAT